MGRAGRVLSQPFPGRMTGLCHGPTYEVSCCQTVASVSLAGKAWKVGETLFNGPNGGVPGSARSNDSRSRSPPPAGCGSPNPDARLVDSPQDEVKASPPPPTPSTVAAGQQGCGGGRGEANLFVGKGGELEGGLRDFTGRAIVSHANLQAAGPGRNPLGTTEL